MSNPDPQPELQTPGGDTLTHQKVRLLIRRLAFAVALLIFTIGCVGLAFTEYSSHQEHDVLDKDLKNVQTISADHIDPANEGKTVHVQGVLSGSHKKLEDSDFGVSVNGLILRRRVGIYAANMGGRIIHYGWERAREDAAFAPLTVETKMVLGSFRLNPELTENMTDEGWHHVPIDEKAVASLPANKTAPLRLDADGFLHTGIGTNENPEPGDERVSFVVFNPGMVSMLAKQSGNELTRFDDHAYIWLGKLTPQEMSKTAFRNSDDINVWLCRPPCLIAIIIGGLGMIFALRR